MESIVAVPLSSIAAEREQPLLVTGGPMHIRLYKCCAPVRVLHEYIVGVGHEMLPGRVKNTQCVYVCAYRRFASESSIQCCIPAPSHPVRSIRPVRTQHTSTYGPCSLDSDPLGVTVSAILLAAVGGGGRVPAAAGRVSRRNPTRGTREDPAISVATIFLQGEQRAASDGILPGGRPRNST